MTENLVIIPSAKLVSVELQAEFGPIPPAMIPIDGRPSLHYITEQHRSLSFLVAVNEAAADVEAYVNQHIENEEVRVLNVGSTRSLGETILKAIDSLELLPPSIIIQFADTAVPNLVAEGDSMCYAIMDETYRWTTFRSDGKGRIISINEKDTYKESTQVGSNVFVGVFSIAHVNDFITSLRESCDVTNDIDTFYSALQRYSQKHSIRLELTEDWLDFGHLDTYYKSRKKLCAPCREFNSISIDSQRGKIIKTSRNRDKFIDEIRWYLLLPEELQHIAPRVFKYDIESDEPQIQMEFYGYPVLNDLYLFGHLDLGTWSRIFKSIAQAFDDLSGHRLQTDSVEKLHHSQREMYETKTYNRIKTYRTLSDFAWATEDTITVNGTPTLSLQGVLDSLPQVLDEAGIYNDANFSIIHGDPCFSNILYDPRNGIVRMVDPRGKFGSHDIYGDPRYDWCKLNHSIVGDYDFLVHGLFQLKRHKSDIVISANLSPRHRAIKKVYLDCFMKRFGMDEFRRLRLLESLLFLSMVPLHSDRPRSQQAFLATGLALYTEFGSSRALR